MNDFHMEIPLEQRDRLRVLERQRELAMKKRLGEEMDRERAAFILERDRAVGLSERLLARDRLGDRMMGMGRFLDRGREREARLVAGERPVGVDRRLESGVGGSRLDGGVGLSRFETAALVDRRLDGGGDRRLEAVAGRDDDRDGVRPGPRPSTLDRLRQTDRERDEEREKARDRVREEDGITERSATTEKQKERDESAGALQDLVAQYKNALVELTFNSKPIITNLTINAGENAQAAKGIAATICARILEVPNEQKLPTLYLLDSIVKNIGGDYVKYFAARLPEVFCKAYKQVDPSTHPSMQHLFRTWRGVFPGAPLRLIETELQFPPIANGASLTSNSAKAAESPSQRSGHSIHVNPKYLEAQRQRLQQSSRVEAEPTENNGETSIREIERAESVVLDSPKGWPDTPERSTLLPRAQRGDAFGGESGYARKPLSSFLDYDYGSADPRTEIVGERVAARDEAWERGWLSGSEDAVRSSESGAGLRYSQRNGYELRQSSPRALVDAYGNIRGPRAPRMPPPPVQPAQGLDARTKGPLRNWRNSEEEEYVWEDMSPRLLDHARLRETMKNDNWYSGHGDNSLMPGGSSREKPVSLDQPLPDHLSWRRAGALNDRPMSAESRLAIQREPDERIPLSNLQQDIGPRVVPELATDIPTLGSNSRSGLALRPPSRLRHSLPQQLSPPAQSRLRPFVSGRNPSPSSMGSLYLPSQSAKLSLLSSSNGMPEAMGPNMAVRAMMRPGLGSSFGSGMLNLGSLSPVTPVSSITFQQRQQSQRPPSPPPMAPPSQPQLLIIPPIAPVPHLANFQSLQQQNSNLLRPMQHQAPSSGLHGSQSSQQGLPFLSLPQQPPVQQLLQRPPAVQPLPQPQQPLQQTLHTESMPLSQPTSEQKVPSLQPSRSLPMPPQLLQSLQQLQHHLPPISGTSLQQSQASQPQHLQSAPPLVQQGQPPQLLQQTQHPPQQLLPPPSQPLQQPQALAQQPPQLPQVSGYVPQPVGSVVNDNSSSSSGLQSQSNTNLLAAFLQSGLMPPPQSSQILTHRPSSPKASSGSTESTSSQPSTHLQPPLPSGPPPIQASNSGAGPLPGQGVLSLPSGVPIMTSVPVPPLANIPAFTSQPLRMAQPPLPPGPPPVSSQVGTSLSQPPVSGGCLPPSANNLSSLLSSLMAQGLISATSSAPPILPESSGGMAASSTSSVSAFPSSTIGLAFSGAPLVPPLGTLVSGAPALSTTLVTASRTQESMATPIVTSSTERITAMDLIAMEFKQEVLRERHESVINALYFDFPRQCKTCGLRFKLQEDHSKHMDWHVSRNRRQKSSKKISRKWFVSVKEWLSGTGASASEVAPSFFAEDVTVKPEEHEVVAVPADENQSACALCGEPFEDFYSDETEEWMYKGAVYMNVPPGGVTEALDSSHLGPIVHAKCRSESGATVTATDSAEDDEGEEDDELGRRRKRVRY